MDNKIKIDNNIVISRLHFLINQTYKTLPLREEGKDWKTHLDAVFEEIIGFRELLGTNYDNYFVPILCKIKGLYSFQKDEDFSLFRKTILDCLNLFERLCENVS